jgi:tetratricopeptide (TPR) repeat protein
MIEVLLQAESALSLGLLDRAEILYREVAAADPRNSIAVVGLARVALERGNEVEALKVARRALAIDGENAAAQRMVQRLEEVLAFRGIQVPPPTGPAPEPAADAPGQAVTAIPEPDPEQTPPPASRASFLDRLRRR